MTVTTVLVWVICAMQAGGCVATAGSPARTHSYRTLVACLDAAHAEMHGAVEILSCKPRHEILFEFEWTEEPGKGKVQPI
jgi:hypothetical protein